MKRYRILPAVCAAALLVLSSGCSMEELLQKREVSREQEPLPHSDRRYDLEPLRKMAEQMQETKLLPNAETQIREETQAILDEVDKAYAVYAHANMDFYADWNNSELSDLSDETYADYCAADEIATWAFCNACKDSDYDDLMDPYVEQDWLPYYVSNTLNRVISRAREDAADSGALLNDYYATAYDENIDPEDPAETNLSCAQLYLKNLESYDTSEYLYDYYMRDFTVEEASAMYHDLIERMKPLYEELKTYVIEDPRYEELKEGGMAVDDPYATLQIYAPKLSPSIAESVDQLFSGPYYRAAKGTDSYDGSYTVTLPGEKTAMMYTYLAGDYYDLTTVVHEFGHFNADWRDQTPVYLTKNCIDLAEVQSQSMEMLFTSFYDDIYGSEADYLEALALYNIMDSVISGFAVGEFEYRVMQDLEHVSPQDVCDIFDEIMEEAGLSTQLYQITHLFEQPGYYISYGVSALASMQIYAAMQEDFSQAIIMYTNIASLSSNSGDHPFSEALESSGFDNIFEESSLEAVVESVSARLSPVIDG